MKIERILIGLLLLVVVWLFIQKKPTIPTEIRYLTKYEQKIDTIKQEIVKIKLLKQPYYDTIVLYKDKVVEAKVLKDTVKIIEFQDSVINNQDIYIKFQDTLIDKCDSIILYQNKEKEVLKQSITDLTKHAEKQKKRSKITHILGGIGIVTLFILK